MRPTCDNCGEHVEMLVDCPAVGLNPLCVKVCRRCERNIRWNLRRMAADREDSPHD